MVVVNPYLVAGNQDQEGGVGFIHRNTDVIRFPKVTYNFLDVSCFHVWVFKMGAMKVLFEEGLFERGQEYFEVFGFMSVSFEAKC